MRYFTTFAAILLLQGLTLTDATKIAVRFTCAAIGLTATDGTEQRLGVRFESVLNDYGRLFL